MTKDKKKKIWEIPSLIYLFTSVGLIFILTIIALFTPKGLVILDTYFLYGGIITVLTGLFFLNRGSNLNQSRYMKNDDYFHKVRKQERPIEGVVWAVILAGVTIAIIGFLGHNFLIG